MFCRFVFTDIEAYNKDLKKITILKNSKNKILHFKYTNESIDYLYDFLAIRKIPKNEAALFQNQDVHMINFANKKNLLIQPFTPLYLLVFDDKSNRLKKELIYDVSVNDSVAFYNNQTSSLYFVDVLSNDIIGDFKDTQIKTDEDVEEGDFYNNYIIGSTVFNQGLIINDLLLL